MLGRRALARVFAVVGVSGTVLAGMATAPVLGATPTGTVTLDASSPSSATNTQTRTISFTTSQLLVPTSPTPVPTTVTMNRNAVPTDQVVATDFAITTVNSLPPVSHVTATFDFSLANPTLSEGAGYDIEIAQGSIDDQCGNCFHVLGNTPTISKATTETTLGEGGQLSSYVIHGANFAKGPYDGTANPASVRFLHSSTQTLDTNITVGPTVDSQGNPQPTATTAGTITLRLQASGTDVAAYDDDLVVTNTDGKSALCTACLHVEPQPTISSVALAATGDPSIGQNATGQQLVITGTHFQPNALVTIANPTQAVGSINFTQGSTSPDGTQIVLTQVNTSTVTAGGTGSSHKWNVTVANPDWHNVSAAQQLTVNPQPTATSISYPEGGSDVGQGAQARQVKVSGGGLDAGAHLEFPSPGLPSGVIAHDQTVDLLGESVTAQLDVPRNASVGSFPVTIVNGDGGTSAPCATPPSGIPPTSTPCPLQIAAAPSIASISPSTVTAPYTGGPITITGTNFHTGANNVHVSIGPAGSLYLDETATATGSGTVKTITIPSGHINVPGSVLASDTDVTVTNVDDGGVNTAANIFHIANLSVTGVSPTQATNDAPATGVVVSGSNFDSGATVLLRHTTCLPPPASCDIATISGTNLQIAQDGTSLTADFDVTNAAPGDYRVVVTNPANGAHPGTAEDPSVTFTLLASDPTTSSVAPTALGGGASSVAVTVTGTNFYPGSSVSFDSSDITLVGSPTITNGGTKITQYVNVSPGVSSGTTTVTVTNSAGIASNTQNLALDAAPLVVGVTPANHSPDPVQLSVAGSGFVTGATLQFDNSSVHAGNIQVAPDGTSLTADLTFDAGAVPGDAPVAVAVTVVNPDFGQATTPAGNGLQLDPEPRITSVTSPIPAGKATTVTIDGANFLPAANVTAPNGSNVTVSNVQFVNSGQLTATLTVGSNALRGARTLTVDNGDGGVATKDVTVYVVPGPPQSPAGPTQLVAPGNSSLTITWQPPADDGGSAVTGYVVTVTEHGTNNSESHPLGSTATSDTFTALTNGVLYDVSVVAANGAGSGAALTGSGTPRTVPSAPSLTVTPLNGELDLSWSAPADGGSPITGYTATVTQHGTTNSTSHPLGANATADTFPNLTNGTAYDVVLFATNAAGDGAQATDTKTPRAVPGAPTDLVVTPGNGSLSLSWVAPGSNGGNAIDKYVVSVTPHSGGATQSFDAGTTSLDISSLANGSPYDVTVTAHNQAGNGAAVVGSGTPRTVPGAPTALTVTPGDGTLAASWGAPASDGGNGVDKYTVSVTPHAGGTTTTFDTSDASTTSHSFTGLTNGTLYDVTVTAHNAAGNGAAVAGSGTPARASDAPSITAITPGDATIAVSWTAPTANGGAAVQSYRVTVTPHSGGSAVSITTPDAATTSHTFSGLVNGTTYDVAVAANNSAGRSAAATGSATPRFTSTLSIADTAKTVIYGSKITLSGVLKRSDGSGVAGATVSLTRAFDGAAATAYRTVTTDSAGHWTITFAPGLNSAYAAAFAGNSSVAPATSTSVRTTVGPRIIIRSPLNKSTSSVAKALKVTGIVSPNKAGKVVVLYYVTKTGKLVKLTAGRLSAKSTFALSYRLKRGTWHLVVVIGRTPGNVPSSSKKLTVKRV